MHVPVVNVRVMWMSVLQGYMCMAVTVFAAGTIFRIMCVLVMLVMLMFVLMF